MQAKKGALSRGHIYKIIFFLLSFEVSGTALYITFPFQRNIQKDRKTHGQQ